MAHRDALDAAHARIAALERELAEVRAGQEPAMSELDKTVRRLREEVRSAAAAKDRLEIARQRLEAELVLARLGHDRDRALVILERERTEQTLRMEIAMLGERHAQELEIERQRAKLSAERLAPLEEELAVLRSADAAKIRGYYQSLRDAAARRVEGLGARHDALGTLQAALESAEKQPLPDEPVAREMQDNRIRRDRAVLGAQRAALRAEEDYLAERMRYLAERVAAVTGES